MKLELIPGMICALCLLASPIFAGDPDPSPIQQIPRERPLPLHPLIQRDAHSCGYLAMAALYQSYGLNIKSARLRGRAGVDVPAIPFLEDTKGTIQPDLFRVLKQDGFEFEVWHPGDEHGLNTLIEHLRGPHYALSLIKRKSTGSMHWIVLTEVNQKGYVQVADSLVRQKRWHKLETFAKEQIISIILVKPANPYAGVDHNRCLLEGGGCADMFHTCLQMF